VYLGPSFFLPSSSEIFLSYRNFSPLPPPPPNFFRPVESAPIRKRQPSSNRYTVILSVGSRPIHTTQPFQAVYACRAFSEKLSFFPRPDAITSLTRTDFLDRGSAHFIKKKKSFNLSGPCYTVSSPLLPSTSLLIILSPGVCQIAFLKRLWIKRIVPPRIALFSKSLLAPPSPSHSFFPLLPGGDFHSG